MDIRVVFRKGVVYVCAIAVGATVFIVFVELLKRVTGYDKDSIPLPQAVLVAVILAISFQPLKAWLQRSINRYVYRETYDYQRTIRDATRRLSTILALVSSPLPYTCCRGDVQNRRRCRLLASPR